VLHQSYVSIFFFAVVVQLTLGTTAKIDGIDDKKHMMSSLVIGGPGAYIPYPSHSFLTDMGPDQWMLMLDCRSVY
jgi:hypothetical protein